MWLQIVFLNKLCLLGAMVLFGVPLNTFGGILLSQLNPYPRLELLTVMVFVPVVLNSLMFWVTDSLLKHTDPEVDETTCLSKDLPLTYADLKT